MSLLTAGKARWAYRIELPRTGRATSAGRLDLRGAVGATCGMNEHLVGLIKDWLNVRLAVWIFPFGRAGPERYAS